MDIDARAFGQLEGEVKALAQTLEAQNRTLEAQNKKMDQMATQMTAIRTTLAEARGGWKVLLAIGGAASGVTMGLQWLVQHFKP